MKPNREEALFHAALELRDPAARAAFLTSACAADAAMRSRLEALLRASDEGETFLHTPKPQKAAPADDATLGAPAAKTECMVPTEKPGDTIGRYKLLQKVGEGGCGSVYMAEQSEPVRRKVALKVIKLGMDTKNVIARFEAERQALAMMDHPNIAKVLDAGSTDAGRPYFVMELVRGIPITKYCDENNLGTSERLSLFTAVCSAIQSAHQKGIIHRDIKPSNILVTLHDGVPVPKVIDFGIAKATEARLTDMTLFTELHAFVGTPAYMSPEQAEMSGLDIDTRADIYSLGVLLYELLTGRLPFDPETLLRAGLDEMRRTIREVEPPRPSTRVSTLAGGDLTTIAKHRGIEAGKLSTLLRGDLDWIVMKAMEKDRTRRYESASNFAQDIQRHLKHEAVLACPPSSAYLLRKLIRRNRVAFAAGAAVLASIVIGLAVSTVLFFKEKKAHGRAVTAEAQQSKLRSEAQEHEKKAVAAAGRAEAASARATAALKLVELSLINELVAKGQTDLALGRLARRIRQDGSDRVAADKVMFLLQEMSSHSPLLAPIRTGGNTAIWQLSPDGLKLVSTDLETAQLWDTRTGKAIGAPMRHAGRITSAQFNAESTRLATAGALRDMTARTWDALTGLPIGKPVRHANIIHSAHFSPDSQRIVTSSWDYSARIWDVESGAAIGSELRHEQDVTSAQFSPDGTLVITGSRDNTAQLWDARTGKPVGPPMANPAWVMNASFSPDGKWVLLGLKDGSDRVWDVRTRQPVSEPMRQGGEFPLASFSPDGQRVLTAAKGVAFARLWDARTGDPLGEPMRHQSEINSAKFSPDGLRVVTASADNSARVWDGFTGAPLDEPIRHEGGLKSMNFGAGMLRGQFSPDGLRLFTSSTAETRVWSGHSGAPVRQPFRHRGDGRWAHFNPDGSKVLLAVSGTTARIMDVRTARPMGEPLEIGAKSIRTEFSPDGERIITMTPDYKVQLWDARTGKALSTPILIGGASFFHFSADGSLVALRGLNNHRLLDTRSNQLSGIQIPGSATSTSTSFSHDNRHLLVCAGRKASLFVVGTGELASEITGHQGIVTDAQFSSDGRWIATASADKTARIWDSRTHEPRGKAMTHDAGVNAIQFSADGRWVATASKDYSARLWDASTGEPVGEPMRHQGSVSTVAFSADGQRVLTVAEDSTVRVWDFPSGQPLSEPLRHAGPIHRAQFSKDGLSVLTFEAGGGVNVWDVPVAASNGAIPAWLPALADAVTGQRMDDTGAAHAVPIEELFRLREQLIALPGETPAARWVRWFVSDRSTRTLSPFSAITMKDHVRRLVEENSVASLSEAVRHDPTHGLAFARLAKAMLAEPVLANSRVAAEADFYSRHALKLAPDDAEVRKIRTEMETATTTPPR